MIVASILACFNIVKSKDGLGNDIGISNEYEDFGPMRSAFSAVLPDVELIIYLLTDTKLNFDAPLFLVRIWLSNSCRIQKHKVVNGEENRQSY